MKILDIFMEIIAFLSLMVLFFSISCLGEGYMKNLNDIFAIMAIVSGLLFFVTMPYVVVMYDSKDLKD